MVLVAPMFIVLMGLASLLTYLGLRFARVRAGSKARWFPSVLGGLTALTALVGVLPARRMLEAAGAPAELKATLYARSISETMNCLGFGYVVLFAGFVVLAVCAVAVRRT
jgi:hypothetical protein